MHFSTKSTMLKSFHNSFKHLFYPLLNNKMPFSPVFPSEPQKIDDDLNLEWEIYKIKNRNLIKMGKYTIIKRNENTFIIYDDEKIIVGMASTLEKALLKVESFEYEEFLRASIYPF